ncbi:hypothetical protein GZH53_04630 [Flavihumibacter sp. R14]|nr:hypothetical protein [Flavihumibacter soli]
MKNLLLSILALLLLASCQNERSPKQVSEGAEMKEAVPESEKTLDVPWIAAFNDSTQLLEMRKNPVARPGNLNEQDIIDALNLKYPQIRIDSLAIEGNKAIVRIEDASYLTQEIGSAGARVYLAEATYSLTEVGEIEAVDFRFKAGDHATPGILTRRSFESFN